MRAAALAGCLAVLAAGTAGALPQEPPAVEREWRVRARALDMTSASRETGATGATEELRTLLAADAWTARAEALETLRRAGRTGTPLPRALAADVVAALGDANGSVRAGALLALATSDVALDARTLGPLAEDDLPAVRLALVWLLERRPVPAVAGLLVALAEDEDERVRASAERALFAQPPARDASAAKLAALARRFASGDDAGLLAAAAWIEAGPLDARLLAEAPAVCTGFGPRPAAWRTLFTAIGIGRTGAASKGQLADLTVYWPVGSEADERAELLLSAARSQVPALGDFWLERLEHAWRTAASDRLERALPAAAIATLGPGAMLVRARELELSYPAQASLLRALGERLVSWEGIDVAPWLAPEAPDMPRQALAEALGATLLENGDARAGELLVVLLEHADLRLDVFRTLANTEDVAPFGGALHRAWRALPPEERAAELDRLPRGVALPAFRDDLFAFGAQPGAARRSAVELLAGLAGDAAARARVAAWLAEDLDRFEAASDVTRRERELEVQGELRALGAIGSGASEESVELLEDALVRSLGASEEIGKVAATALGRTAGGRERLTRHLGPEVDRRTRIEAAIQLAPHGSERAAEVLVADFPAAAWDLRVRMLRALGGAEEQRSLTFLAEVARDEDAAASERMRALASLAQRGALTPLALVAAGSGDLEIRLVAVRALGALADAAADDVLTALFARVVGETGETGAAESSIERVERELLRAELLGVLGARGLDSAALVDAWLAAPLATAGTDLELRFEREEPAAASFRWPGELALAHAFAERGLAAEALAAIPAWERVDGELLVALGETLRRAGADTAALSVLSAAVVALEGAPLGSDGRVARSRASLFRARARLAGLHWSAGRWSAYLRVARALLADRRAGDFPDGEWREAFGPRDLATERDPARRLDASLEQARARLALERGDLPWARASAERARRSLGRSRRAAEEQAGLERALAEFADD